MSKQPKTDGIVWLEHSLNAFNGTGYADRSTAYTFVNSYIDYCGWKKRIYGVELAQMFYNELLPQAEYLIETSHPTKTASPHHHKKFTSWKLLYSRADLPD